MNIYHLLAAVAASLLVYLLVRGINERFAVYLSLAGSVLILLFICTGLSSVFGFIRHLAESAGVKNEYFEVVLKGLSICYFGEFIIGLCRDCGQSGWGEKVEIACRCTLLVLAIPLFEDFLKIIIGLLE